MSKLIAICGKICSGKTIYANKLKNEVNGIILSTDEITSKLFDNNLGENHDDMCLKINSYLLDKSIELVNVGTNVILDWGFWTKKDRDRIKDICNKNNINLEFHYIDLSDELWEEQIKIRNDKVLKGLNNSYYVDEGLKNKLLNLFEVPLSDEIDVWYSRD